MIDDFVNETVRLGVKIPGIFGVFYYRTPNPKTFAMLSTEQEITNPRFFRAEERVLAKAQRRLSREEIGTPERAR